MGGFGEGLETNPERRCARCPQRGNHFADTSTRARQTIAEHGARFVRSGSRVLVHGFSRVVLALLRLAVKQGIQFDVIVTEGRVSPPGYSDFRF